MSVLISSSHLGEDFCPRGWWSLNLSGVSGTGFIPNVR